ncbi:MAG: hypothetical protein JRI97_07585, partial [Deltaproteobacteria bacterium]|nr:hypothetical protein [Deltaproteobacteria bacterium]
MSDGHERYRRIDLFGAGPAGAAERGNTLKVILFRKEEKLRSHAVKHFTNLAESDTTFKVLSREDQARVTRAIGDLQDLGCPYFTQGLATPPCEGVEKRCPMFLACGRILRGLENTYLELVEDFLRQSGAAPRYAYFFS